MWTITARRYDWEGDYWDYWSDFYSLEHAIQWVHGLTNSGSDYDEILIFDLDNPNSVQPSADFVRNKLQIDRNEREQLRNISVERKERSQS